MRKGKQYLPWRNKKTEANNDRLYVSSNHHKTHGVFVLCVDNPLITWTLRNFQHAGEVTAPGSQARRSCSYIPVPALDVYRSLGSALAPFFARRISTKVTYSQNSYCSVLSVLNFGRKRVCVTKTIHMTAHYYLSTSPIIVYFKQTKNKLSSKNRRKRPGGI